ncbi:MAG: cytochrome c peroxidase [Myxococcota bacterium]
MRERPRRPYLRALGSLLVALASAGLAGPALAGEFPPLGPLPELEAPDPAAVEWGKMLFFDNRISGDADIRCSTCHDPAKGWADGLPLSDGYPGTKYFRNTKTVVNAVHADYFYWDGRLDGQDLETQARDAITDSHFHAADGRIMLERQKQIPEYVALSQKAFGGEPSFGRMLRALAAFERTLVSRNVPFDQYARGDASALSPEAKRGLELFQGKAGCIRCHNGPYFSDGQAHNVGAPDNPAVFSEIERHITMRSVLKFLGTANYMNLRQDPGYCAVSNDPEHMGRFLTPTLREVSRTAPYMHSGMLATLEEVIDFYDRGGGDRPGKSPLLVPLGLSQAEKDALLAFLASLSGDEILIEIAQEDLPKYQLIEDWYEVRN